MGGPIQDIYLTIAAAPVDELVDICYYEVVTEDNGCAKNT